MHFKTGMKKLLGILVLGFIGWTNFLLLFSVVLDDLINS